VAEATGQLLATDAEPLHIDALTAEADAFRSQQVGCGPTVTVGRSAIGVDDAPPRSRIGLLGDESSGSAGTDADHLGDIAIRGHAADGDRAHGLDDRGAQAFALGGDFG
jgi:hypothetical protein